MRIQARESSDPAALQRQKLWCCTDLITSWASRAARRQHRRFTRSVCDQRQISPTALFNPPSLTCSLNQSAWQLFQGETIVFITIDWWRVYVVSIWRCFSVRATDWRLSHRQVRHEKQKSAAPPGKSASWRKVLIFHWHFRSTKSAHLIIHIPPGNHLFLNQHAEVTLIDI